MSYTSRDRILREQHNAARNYLLAMVEPSLDPSTGHLMDGFELYGTSPTFHHAIDEALRFVLPALVNGYALTARREDRRREELQRQEMELMRVPPMEISRQQLVALFGEEAAAAMTKTVSADDTVLGRVMRDGD